MNARELLFKIIAGGHQYLIYANGEVEGFGSDPTVVNRSSLILAMRSLERSDAASRSRRIAGLIAARRRRAPA